MSGQRPPDGSTETTELRLERVGGARSGTRRPLAAAVLILAFVGLAIAKPWAPAGGGPAFASPSVPPTEGSDAVEPAPRPSARPVRQADWAPIPFVAGPREPVPALSVRAAVRPHDGWGIRAVVQGPSDGATGPLLDERWAPTSPELSVDLDSSGLPVRALGLTAPAGLLVLDVRVSVVVGGVARWLDTEPVAGANPGSGLLLWGPRSGDAWLPAWPAGDYRIDVLTAAGVGQFGVRLTGPAETMPEPRPVGRRWVGADGSGFAALGPDLRDGVFLATVPDGGAPADLAPAVMGLGGRTTAGLGYGTAWLDTLAGQASQVTAFGVTAYAPDAVSIGVMTPPGFRIDGGKLVRMRAGLAGGPTDPADRAVGTATEVRASPGESREAIRFDEPDGRAWQPGSYAMIIDGAGPGGHDTIGYLVTLLPGSARTTAAPLAAARAWARFAGRWGIAAGLLEPLDAPGRLAIRYAATEPESVVGGGADFTTRCLEVNLIDSSQPIVGIGHPTGIRPGAVEVQRVYLDGSVSLARPATALSVLPGLTMVAPPEGAGWTPGWYRLVVQTDTSRLGLPVCVGSTGPGYLAVPPDAGRRAGDG